MAGDEWMNDGWKQPKWSLEWLDPQHMLLIAVTLGLEGAEFDPIEIGLRVSVHPMIRKMSEGLFATVMESLNEGVMKLRRTPLDDMENLEMLGEESCDS